MNSLYQNFYVFINDIKTNYNIVEDRCFYTEDISNFYKNYEYNCGNWMLICSKAKLGIEALMNIKKAVLQRDKSLVSAMRDCIVDSFHDNIDWTLFVYNLEISTEIRIKYLDFV